MGLFSHQEDGRQLTVPTLNDFLNGAYSSTPFRGKWISGTKFAKKGDDGSLVSHDVVNGQVEILVPADVLTNLSISEHIISPDGKKVRTPNISQASDKRPQQLIFEVAFFLVCSYIKVN